jgi:acyl-coenzyme A synthetase/AMP-(fatty) acid ligase
MLWLMAVALIRMVISLIMGRIGDVINVAGHRLFTGSIEEIVSKHKDIAECAVLGALARFKEAPIVKALPKTRSGKDCAVRCAK